MRFFTIIQLIICFCVFALFTSILFDFLLFSKTENIKKEKKSIVETGTMTLFFIFYYLILLSKKGILEIQNGTTQNLLYIIGTFIIVIGCILNIIGRFNLGGNWGNHIKIYEEHTLIKNGLYKFVRHPLYSSIILMFYGGSIVYQNIFSSIAVTFIFIPFMYYRAKQEEKLLLEVFPEYTKYKNKAGMFFPKLIRKD